MNLGGDINGHDVLTADEALLPWTLASDDVFIEQMIEAAPAPQVAHAGEVDPDLAFAVPAAANDRIDEILARFDDGALFAADRADAWTPGDLPAILSAPVIGHVELPLPGGDGPEILPAPEDGPQVLPGVMDDDFLKLEDLDHRVVLPFEIEDGRHYQSGGHDMVVYPAALILNDDGLYVPDHSHDLIGHDDWLF